MTVKLNRPPQVEQAYVDEARARGLPLADVMREALIAAHPTATADDISAEEWSRLFNAWTASHAAIIVVLSDAAMERESVYADRGL